MRPSVVYGIEPMIILKDICQATDRETEAVVRWMMDALVDAAMREGVARPIDAQRGQLTQQQPAARQSTR